MLALAKSIQQTVDIIVAQSPSSDEESIARLQHYVWVALLILPINLGLALYNVFQEDYSLAFIATFFSVYMLGSLFLIPKLQKPNILYHIANIYLVSLILYMIHHDHEISHIVWAYTYPIGIIFLFGNRLGFLWSCILLTLILMLFIFFPYIHQTYSFTFMLRFCIAYMVIAFITGWIEYHRMRYQKESIETYEKLYQEQAHLKEEIKRRIALESELHHLARTDSLTGLCNRRYFLELAEHEIQRAERYKLSFCFAILDVDRFKEINDRYGHPAGDKVLKILADYCKKSLRESDLIARLGGEEFAIMLLHVNDYEAVVRLEKLKEELSTLSVETGAGETIKFTVSIGMAMFSHGLSLNIDQLYTKADKKLYQAKEAGRNRVY